MKNIMFLVSALVVTSLVHLPVMADPVPVQKELNIAVNGAFVPTSVPADTDAKIVLSGMYPNSCYHWSRSTVNSPSTFVHEVRALAFVTQNTICLMVLVPFNEEVNLGRLPSGDHTLRFINGDDTYFERHLTVQ